MDKWINILQAKPQAYIDVIAKIGTEEWKSYMYPSGEWAFKKAPAYWKYVSNKVIEAQERDARNDEESGESREPTL